MEYQDELKIDVFPGPTTYLNDFRRYHGVHRRNPDYSRAKFENPLPTPPAAEIVDKETFIPLRKKIPMSLMIQPNEITGKDPHKEFGDTVSICMQMIARMKLKWDFSIIIFSLLKNDITFKNNSEN